MDEHHKFFEIDRAMATALADKVFPGAVLLWACREKVIYHRGFGVTAGEGSQAVGPDTVYDLASLTKPLATALAIADLVKRDKIRLETEMAEVLSETRGTAKAGITVDMLLRHTSGLPAHRPFFKQIPSGARADRVAVLRRLLMDEPLESEPGQRECYSDLGYMLLSWMVEKVCGRDLEICVNERIYRPLGIDRLGYSPLDRPVPAWMAGAAATMDCPWRNKVMQAEVEDENAWAAGGVEGHAGLFGTAPAVHLLCCEILKALNDNWPSVLDSAILSSFVRRMPGRTRVAGFDTPSGENSAAGKSATPETIGHLGFTGTSFWMDPGSGLITILLTNRVHPSRENLKIRNFRPWIHDLVFKAFKRIIRV